MPTQYGLRLLFVICIATAMIAFLFVALPVLPGFDAQYSRRFLVLGGGGAALAGASLTAIRERFLSARFVLRLGIGTYLAVAVSYGVLYLHSKQSAGGPSWPSMAVIYLLPGMFFLSAIVASMVCVVIPKGWMDFLESACMGSIPSGSDDTERRSEVALAKRYPTAAFLIGCNVVAFGMVLLCFRMDSWSSGFVLTIPVFGPLLLMLIPMWFCYARSAQGVFGTAAIIYAAWFVGWDGLVPYHSPTQSFIRWLSVGLLAAPVVFLTTILGVGLHLQETRDL